MDLKDKVSLITGGASGIGFAMAGAFAARGAKVVIADVKGVDEAVARLAGAGAQAAGQPCDVRDEADVARLMDFAVATFGGLDVVVANAGVLRDGLLLRVDRETKKVAGKLPLSQWKDVIDVNLTGVFLTGREAAAKMVDLNTRGVIIALSSISAKGNFGQTNYAASKAAVISLTRVSAIELGVHGIRVNCICPGYVLTEMGAATRTPEMVAKWSAMSPLGRCAEPSEVADMALFLASDQARYCTGQAMNVSGGMVMH